MPVSSTTLFHFTNSMEKLIGIIKNNFIPHYSLERFYLGKDEVKVGIPMVSFCDIPLAQIESHLKIYGYYGIGLTKSWANYNRLNPVLYLDKNSLLSYKIKGLFESITNSDGNSKLEKEMKNIIMYIKLYQGYFIRNNISYKMHNFYNEREWRYIPNNRQYLEVQDFNDEEIRETFNFKIKNDRLNFQPKDIRYIIIKESKELRRFIRELKLIKSASGISTISRIITSNQILSDF